MARSDLSGSPIEADTKAEVVVRLADGHARRLTVTASEAEDLAGKGIPVGGLRYGIRAFVVRNWKSVGWWAFGLLVATVLLPAATKQWSDRQAALALKNSLISEINTSSVKAWLAGERILQTTDDDDVRKLRAKALEDWTVAESAIDSVFALYFSRTEAQSKWVVYRDAVYDYVQYACCTEPGPSDPNPMPRPSPLPMPGPNRLPPIPDPSSHLPVYGPDNPGPLQLQVRQASPSTYQRLFGPKSNFWQIQRSSPNHNPALRSSYQEVGRNLLQQRQPILDAVRATSANGYSDGWIDFWRDVVPGW
jgi:hypothetical protein